MVVLVVVVVVVAKTVGCSINTVGLYYEQQF